MRPSRLVAAAAVLALAACVATEDHERLVAVEADVLAAFLADKPPQLHAQYERVLTEGERNRVLNHMRAGLAAMELGDEAVAASSFDDALNRIEAVYADNAKAEHARSVFVKENFKDFKGEPYERAMAFYYRGLLYLREGDYENARASFKSGMLQDSFAESEKYLADFALMAFLEGWASHCLGKPDLAKESFAEATRLRDTLTAPAEDHDLLLIAETGSSPIKVARGRYRERLEYKRGGDLVDGANFLVAEAERPGARIEARLAEDIYWQASTRGGRQVQAILDGKVRFKDTADAVGDVAYIGGVALMAKGSEEDDKAATYAGLGLLIASVVAEGIAASTRPDADIRYWDNLPDRVHLATVKAPSRPFAVSVEYTAGETRNDDSAKPVEIFRAGRCAIGWSRSRPAADIPVSAPGAVKP